MKDAQLNAENDNPGTSQIHAAGRVKEDTELNMSGCPGNPCSIAVDEPEGNSLQDKNLEGTDGSATLNDDSEHPTRENGPATDCHNEALLLTLVKSNGAKTEDGSEPISADGEITEETENESNGAGKEVNTENKATEGEPGHIPLSSDASDDTKKNMNSRGNVIEENQIYSLANSDTSENIDGSGIKSENEKSGGSIAPEQGQTIRESSSEIGSKTGDSLNRILEQSDAVVSNDDMTQGEADIEQHMTIEETVEANDRKITAGPDHAVSKRNIIADGITGNDVLKNNQRGIPEEANADKDFAGNDDGPDILADTMMDDSLHQFNPDEKPGSDAMRFARILQNTGTDLSGRSIHSMNGIDTSYGSNRAIANISHGNAVNVPEFQELLDDIVYIMKSPNKLGVIVDHETLGKLNINVRMEKGLVHVQINTSDKGVRELIEHNVQQIVDSLDRDGVSVGEFTIALKDKQNRENAFYHENNGREAELIHTVQDENSAMGLVNIFA